MDALRGRRQEAAAQHASRDARSPQAIWSRRRPPQVAARLAQNAPSSRPTNIQIDECAAVLRAPSALSVLAPAAGVPFAAFGDVAIIAAAPDAAVTAPPASAAPVRTPAPMMLPTAEPSSAAVNSVATHQAMKPCAVSRK